MAETWNKKEREKKKKQKRNEKAQKKQEQKENSNKAANPASMIAYVDEYGNLSDTPPDLRKRIIIKAEDIEISTPRYDPANDLPATRTGIISFFNHDKGFGFIKDLKTQESVFVHVNALSETVAENNKVSFEIEMGPRGSNAINVKLVK
ncbi:MAG TPA: cold shock domain-containing protein [Ferruginibacter sp.]|nr:DNA-binding protein [Chitinophagaceae bacterium]HRI25344.1 cold shock domain-containing protein [Ferruginibacter sp.]